MLYGEHVDGVVPYLPADKTEPWEAVVKGVAACHHVLAVLCRVVGHVGGAVVHLSHQIEPLPVRSDNNPIESATNETQHGVN